MSVTLTLPMMMRDCPEYWQRFAEVHDDWNDIKAALEEYNAYPYSQQEGWTELYIDFDSEQDLTMFILRWS